MIGMLLNLKRRNKNILNPQREFNRKERGKWEYTKMLERYDGECGECITYKINIEEIVQDEGNSISVHP